MKAPIRANFPAECANASASPVPWWCISQYPVDGRTLQLAGRSDGGKICAPTWWSCGATASCRSRVSSLVTHNIEEAVLMCDRVLLVARPIRDGWRQEIRIDLPQPRDRTSPQFEDYVDKIYVEMTARRVERIAPGPRRWAPPALRCRCTMSRPTRFRVSDRGAGGDAL